MLQQAGTKKNSTVPALPRTLRLQDAEEVRQRKKEAPSFSLTDEMSVVADSQFGQLMLLRNNELNSLVKLLKLVKQSSISLRCGFKRLCFIAVVWI